MRYGVLDEYLEDIKEQIDENSMNLASLTKNELKDQLALEISFYDDDPDGQGLAKIICNELPRSMVYRIISKLYRVRKNKTAV